VRSLAMVMGGAFVVSSCLVVMFARGVGGRHGSIS
jgi:hypothetical protein